MGFCLSQYFCSTRESFLLVTSASRDQFLILIDHRHIRICTIPTLGSVSFRFTWVVCIATHDMDVLLIISTTMWSSHERPKTYSASSMSQRQCGEQVVQRLLISGKLNGEVDNTKRARLIVIGKLVYAESLDSTCLSIRSLTAESIKNMEFCMALRVKKKNKSAFGRVESLPGDRFKQTTIAKIYN